MGFRIEFSLEKSISKAILKAKRYVDRESAV